MMQPITVAEYEQAEGQIRAEEGRISFYVHAGVYLLVNAMLLAINLAFVPQVLWFFFPLLGWGIGLTMHYLFAVRFVRRETRDWQARVEQRARELHAQPVGATS